MEYVPDSRIVLGDGIQREIRSSFCLPRAHGETTIEVSVVLLYSYPQMRESTPAKPGQDRR